MMFGLGPLGVPSVPAVVIGEVPIGHGALDETFDFNCETEQTTAGLAQAGVFLDCSKCYERCSAERMLSRQLEALILESGYPPYALYAALNMYSGRQRFLIQGVVSQPVIATHGPWRAARMWTRCGPSSCLSAQKPTECS
eukprot:6461173-Amphidinium_carterae.1